MAVQERALSQEELDEFADYNNRAMTNLGLANLKAEPEAVVQAVEDFVERWQPGRRNPLKKLLARGPSPVDVALDLIPGLVSLQRRERSGSFSRRRQRPGAHHGRHPSDDGRGNGPRRSSRNLFL